MLTSQGIFPPSKSFCGTANPVLAQEVCWYLDIPLGKADVERFPNGEIRVQIEESVRGCDVFVIQPPPLRPMTI